MDVDARRDILPRLANPADAKRVFEHKFLKSLYCVGERYHFLEPGARTPRSLRGLTTVLRELYWPELRFGGACSGKRASSSSSSVSAAKRARVAPVTADAGADTLLAKARGHVRGSIVHQQLHDLLTLERRSYARKNEDGTHPWAQRLLRDLLARGELPLCSEFLVADPELGLATRLDLLAVNERSGHLTVYEFKTAEHREPFYRGDAAAPFAGLLQRRLANSALNRAALQASIGAIMASQMLELKGMFKVYVVLLTEAATEFIEVQPDFVVGTAADVYVDIRRDHAARMAKKRQKKAGV